MPRSKRLLTDARSSVFVYLTGHGGNELLKFQGNEEISVFDIADAFEQMWQKKRYRCSFAWHWVADDGLQRAFLHDRHVSSKYDVLENLFPEQPGNGLISASETSYSVRREGLTMHALLSLITTHRFQYENDNVAVIDSFTHHILQFMERINKTSHVSMQDLVRVSTLRLQKKRSLLITCEVLHARLPLNQVAPRCSF